MTKLQEIVEKYLQLIDKPIKTRNDNRRIAQIIKEMSAEQIKTLKDNNKDVDLSGLNLDMFDNI